MLQNSTAALIQTRSLEQVILHTLQHAPKIACLGPYKMFRERTILCEGSDVVFVFDGRTAEKRAAKRNSRLALDAQHVTGSW